MSVPVWLVILYTRFLCKVDMPNSVTYLNQKPVFSGTRLDVVLDTDFKKASCFRKRLDYVLKIREPSKLKT